MQLVTPKTAGTLALITGIAVSGCTKNPAPPGEAARQAPAALVTAAEPTHMKASHRRVKAAGQLGPGAGTLVISIEPPAKAKLTEGAPLSVVAHGEHLKFPKRIKTKLDKSSLPIRLPIVVADGATGPAEVSLTYYWCTEGNEAACRPERTKLTVDLDLTGDAPGGEAHFTHRPM
ncbi:MAG: hypothetical protein KC776_19390 [Myxococcales bacterium]|nr:hypothetical protein [Myxococcales bacterium]MCB9576158.1 hypothetical protein [Polyangiaceae bacterium]